MDYDKICKDVLSLDPKIRFAGICDESGDTKYGGMREGISSILSPEETRKSNQQAIGRWGLRNALTPKTGKGRYAMAEYEKMKRVTLPINDNYLLLVTMEVEADHGSIIDHILKLIKK
ncbi:MAG: hypothetical protein M3Z01_00200 [Thermoproteota archaeon]|nr:hypothetical protein [Thermoproteota archaeon]